MKKIIFFVLIALPCSIQAQSNSRNEVLINEYLQAIQDNRAMLTAFFQAMPKGGDLHHHFSGSVYGETFLDILEKEDFWINRKTLKIEASEPPNSDQAWAKVSTLKELGVFESLKNDLLMYWSVKDYYTNPEEPSHEHFFDSFGKFDEASDLAFYRGLKEMKDRALSENVQYIETMLRTIKYDWSAFEKLEEFNNKLRQAQVNRDVEQLNGLFDQLYQEVTNIGIDQWVEKHNNRIHQAHDSLKLEGGPFTMRYQNFVLRFFQPAKLFTDLVLCFASADQSPLITGVNIVSPEHGTVSMRDYWLHMHMFRYCSDKFPGVKKSLHAGELVLGLVPPEQLTWHIDDAVRVAGANRIGHGVDIAHERQAYDLLSYMKENQTCVEINLWSNAYILEVESDEHPIQLYYKSGVPIVLSTDDAGVLRSNLTDQYVMLVHEHGFLSYAEIKEIVYNSIHYSFIEEEAVRKRLLLLLDQEFKQFEEEVLTFVKDRN